MVSILWSFMVHGANLKGRYNQVFLMEAIQDAKWRLYKKMGQAKHEGNQGWLPEGK